MQSSPKHPPQIKKQLPSSVSERLLKNSSDQKIFNTAKPKYEDALKELGYDVDLKCTNNKSEKLKTQKQKIIHGLIHHFSRGQKLHKIFNRNLIKVG